jgi:Spy/CpxP family protein refolding chaperone
MHNQLIRIQQQHLKFDLKINNQQQQLMDINHDKQLALQKLLADSRIESNSIIVSKNDDDNEDFGKRKRDDK